MINTQKIKCWKETVRKYYKYITPATGYRQLTCLKSDGSQYINTGIYDVDTVDATWKLNAWSQYFGVYGNYINETTNVVRLIGQASNNNGLYINSNSRANTAASVTVNYFDEVHSVVTNTSITINGTTTSITQTAGSANTTNICLFGANAAGDFNGQINCISFLKNDSLVREFVPVERMSDNVLGMYDKVNNVFYTNNGTGTFAAGDYIYEESTSSDYDFYEDVIEYKGLKKVVRTYYKYVYETFVQPTLTENGTIGGDSFAVTASTQQTGRLAWNAFDNDANTMWATTTQNAGWIEHYSPNPIQIDQIEWTVYANATYRPSSMRIYAGDTEDSLQTIMDFSSFNTAGVTTTITLPANVGYHKIHRFQTLGQVYNNTVFTCVQANFTATEKKLVESTSSDYDFYEDVDTYYGFKE